jgi:RNA polymerase sigma-70 factor (ECF subfamily)
VKGVEAGVEADSAIEEVGTGAPELEQLVRDHWAPVFRVVRALVRDHALAEDITQEALLKAWKGLATFRGESSLRTWILRIAHNTAISTLRKRQPEPREPWNLPEHPFPAQTSDLVVDDMMMEQFQRALGELPPATRSIVVLREVEGRSYEEIAEIVRLPLSTVRTRLFRARKELARALKGWQE